jgi:hypothetical protein
MSVATELARADAECILRGVGMPEGMGEVEVGGG